MYGLQPQIILLKEGTDTSQGKAQLVSNINACMAVVDTIRTTLGPRGMDKLIHNDKVGSKAAAVKSGNAKVQIPVDQLLRFVTYRRARSRSPMMVQPS